MTSDSGSTDQSHSNVRLGAATHNCASVTSQAFIDFQPNQDVVPSAGKLSTATSLSPAAQLFTATVGRRGEVGKGKMPLEQILLCSLMQSRIPVELARKSGVHIAPHVFDPPTGDNGAKCQPVRYDNRCCGATSVGQCGWCFQ